MKFRVRGPMNRPTAFEYCACGLAYTTYWSHRQTKEHKAALLRWRKESREQRTAA